MATILELNPLLVLAILLTSGSSNSEPQSDPCLSGFMQTIPSQEEWDSYTAVEVDGGRFLYPELMFTCYGILSNVTVPYFTTPGIAWDDTLSLEMGIWRREVEGWYAEVQRIQITDVQTTRNSTGSTKGNATVDLLSPLPIEKYDIIFLSTRECRGSTREHIPYLLKEYQPRGSSETVLVPIIHVSFDGLTDEGIHTTSDSLDASTIRVQISPSPTSDETDSVSLEVAVGLAMLLTQVEATVLSVMVTVLVMYCCCIATRTRKNREYGTSINNRQEPEYDIPTPCSKLSDNNSKEEIYMSPSPAYDSSFIEQYRYKRRPTYGPYRTIESSSDYTLTPPHPLGMVRSLSEDTHRNSRPMYFKSTMHETQEKKELVPVYEIATEIRTELEIKEGTELETEAATDPVTEVDCESGTEVTSETSNALETELTCKVVKTLEAEVTTEPPAEYQTGEQDVSEEDESICDYETMVYMPDTEVSQYF